MTSIKDFEAIVGYKKLEEIAKESKTVSAAWDYLYVHYGIIAWQEPILVALLTPRIKQLVMENTKDVEFVIQGNDVGVNLSFTVNKDQLVEALAELIATHKNKTHVRIHVVANQSMSRETKVHVE